MASNQTPIRALPARAEIKALAISRRQLGKLITAPHRPCLELLPFSRTQRLHRSCEDQFSDVAAPVSLGRMDRRSGSEAAYAAAVQAATNAYDAAELAAGNQYFRSSRSTGLTHAIGSKHFPVRLTLRSLSTVLPFSNLFSNCTVLDGYSGPSICDHEHFSHANFCQNLDRFRRNS